MKYFQVRQEGERLLVKRSHGPLASDALTFGGMSTALSLGAWKSWAASLGVLPWLLTILAAGTGAGAALMWRQLERAMASDDGWIFDRGLDLVEHSGERKCALSEVAQVFLDLDWRQESHSLLLKTRGGASICVEENTLQNDELAEIAKMIADFSGAELKVVRPD